MLKVINKITKETIQTFADKDYKDAYLMASNYNYASKINNNNNVFEVERIENGF